MDHAANRIIDGLGGSTAVSKMIEAPLSTVHSWRRIGIPASRLAHLRLAVQAKGINADVDALAAADPAEQRAPA